MAGPPSVPNVLLRCVFPYADDVSLIRITICLRFGRQTGIGQQKSVPLLCEGHQLSRINPFFCLFNQVAHAAICETRFACLRKIFVDCLHGLFAFRVAIKIFFPFVGSRQRKVYLCACVDPAAYRYAQ